MIHIIELDEQLIQDLAQRDKRIDNRQFEEYRTVTVEKGIVSSAEGSARVKIGATEVIAGIKMGIGTPFPDTPDEGVLMVAAELLTLASPDFEPGPPGEKAVELARVVDRAIRESKAIDMKKLCITPKEKVWMIYVDIDVLDNGGNLIDAASLAAAAALLDTRMPEIVDERPNYDEKGYHKLPMAGVPLSSTAVKVGGRIFADPNLAEENAADARLTVGTIDKEHRTMVCSLQKGHKTGILFEDVEAMLDLAVRKGEELRALAIEA